MSEPGANEGATPEPSDCMKDPRRGQRILLPAEWRAIAESLALSGREFQILRHIFDDDKESTIAQTLDISAHTVHTHVGRLYRKLGVASRCELLVRVFAEYSDAMRSRGWYDGMKTAPHHD